MPSAGSGGDGGDGVEPGAGGEPGSDGIEILGNRTESGDNFQPGDPGEPCPKEGKYAVVIEVEHDPNGLDAQIGWSGVTELLIELDPDAGTISISGEPPWVHMSGAIDAEGAFSFMHDGRPDDFDGIDQYQVAVNGVLGCNYELEIALHFIAFIAAAANEVVYHLSGSWAGRLDPPGGAAHAAMAGGC